MAYAIPVLKGTPAWHGLNKDKLFTILYELPKYQINQILTYSTNEALTIFFQCIAASVPVSIKSNNKTILTD